MIEASTKNGESDEDRARFQQSGGSAQSWADHQCRTNDDANAFGQFRSQASPVGKPASCTACMLAAKP